MGETLEEKERSEKGSHGFQEKYCKLIFFSYVWHNSIALKMYMVLFLAIRQIYEYWKCFRIAQNKGS